MCLHWQALNYSEELLSQREVVPVDIASEQPSSADYKPEQVIVSQAYCSCACNEIWLACKAKLVTAVSDFTTVLCIL